MRRRPSCRRPAPVSYTHLRETTSWLHPGISAAVYCNGKRLGVFGKLANEINAELEIAKEQKDSQNIYLGELDYEALMSCVAGELRYKPLKMCIRDSSYGASMARRGDEVLRRHYFGSLDTGRMVANSAFEAPFDPPMLGFRSDPYDLSLIHILSLS